MATTLNLSVSLPGSPDEFYDTYTNADRHAALIGAGVFVATSPGGEFRAFDDKILGRILHTSPKRMIVQTWRSMGWKPGELDSILVLTLTAEPGGMRVDLTHVGVPDDDAENVANGWENSYFKPWREARAAA